MSKIFDEAIEIWDDLVYKENMYTDDEIEPMFKKIEKALKLGKLYKELAKELNLSIDIDDYDDGDISKSYEFINVGMIEKELSQEKAIEIVREIEVLENE